MNLPVLCLVLLQAIGDQDGQASWPAQFTLAGSVGRLNQSSYGGFRGDGSVGATWFVLRPIVDDETPLALQAYLQRLSWLAFAAGVGGLLAGEDTTTYKHSYRSANGALSGHFYRGDWVLGGRLLYEGVADHQSGGTVGSVDKTTHYFSASISSGIRRGTLEVVGTYRWRSYYDDGHLRPASWGQAVLNLQSVADEAIYASIGAYTLTDGGGASAEAEFFSTTRLGIWIRGFFETGQVYVNSTTDYHQFGISLGTGWWATRSFELQLSLGFSSANRTSGSSPALTTGLLGLGIVARGPGRF
jgi:hypothetical protein